MSPILCSRSCAGAAVFLLAGFGGVFVILPRIVSESTWHQADAGCFVEAILKERLRINYGDANRSEGLSLLDWSARRRRLRGGAERR
jgi:hypothetical protein